MFLLGLWAFSVIVPPTYYTGGVSAVIRRNCEVVGYTQVTAPPKSK